MSIKSALTKTAALVALSIAVIGGSGLAASQAEAGHKHKHKHFGKFGVGIVLGAPVVYGGYGYHGYHGYGRRCGWLRSKAMHTGSNYWWKRFHRCRRGW